MKRFLESRVAFILLLLVVVAGLPLLTLLLIDQREAGVRPPPLRYLATPDPQQEPICPGGTIFYSFRFDLDASLAPVALTVDRGIWSLAQGRFVVGSHEPVTYPYNRSARISRTSSYRIPLTMDDGKPFPPGEYELMVTGESEGRETVGFAIPFEIPTNC